MKTDLFQSCGHCWVFQICWHVECSTFTASSFRIWNSSAGIPLPPLALFVVMLPKAHLTSHSRMSGSSWVITPSWSYLCLEGAKFYNLHFKKAFHDPDSHDGGITHLEPDILECEIKWALESITMNTASGARWNSSWAISNPERWCCESAALNMPANLENSAVATGTEFKGKHILKQDELFCCAVISSGLKEKDKYFFL